MPRIRVDPADLHQSAEVLADCATRLEAGGARLLRLAAEAPAYDGQFAPAAQALAGEAWSEAQASAARLLALAEQLRARARAFEQADLAARSGLGTLSARLQAWAQSQSSLFSAYLQSPAERDLEEVEAVWLGLRTRLRPQSYDEWQAAARAAGLPLSAYLTRSLSLSTARINAFSAIALTETKEVGLEAVLYATLTLLNRDRLEARHGAIATGQYHAMAEIIALRPDLFLGASGPHGPLLDQVALSPAGAALLPYLRDPTRLQAALDTRTYWRYQGLLLEADDRWTAQDHWRALAASGALAGLFNTDLDETGQALRDEVRATVVGELQAVDLRREPGFLQGMAAYGQALQAGGLNHRLIVSGAALGLPGDLRDLLVRDPQAAAAPVGALVARWLGQTGLTAHPENCSVEQNGSVVRVRFSAPGLSAPVTVQVRQDGTDENLQVDLPGGRAALAQRAAELTTLLAAGCALGDPALFFPAAQYGEAFVRNLRLLHQEGAVFEANPHPGWLETVTRTETDPVTGAAETTTLTRYQAALLDQAQAHRRQAAGAADEATRAWHLEQAARHAQAAESFVGVLGPDGRTAFIAMAGTWPYLGGPPPRQP